MKTILDACCGPRLMWFNKQHPLAVYQDIRRETVSRRRLERGEDSTQTYVIAPDVIGDFRKMDFPDETFSLVVFDPPHLDSITDTAWLAKAYGRLFSTWETDLAAGFAECFRVLKPGGVLVFKWNEHDIAVSSVLKLTPEQPLFGHKTGKHGQTHWLLFMKGASVARTEAPTNGGRDEDDD